MDCPSRAGARHQAQLLTVIAVARQRNRGWRIFARSLQHGNAVNGLMHD